MSYLLTKLLPVNNDKDNEKENPGVGCWGFKRKILLLLVQPNTNVDYTLLCRERKYFSLAENHVS